MKLLLGLVAGAAVLGLIVHVLIFKSTAGRPALGGVANESQGVSGFKHAAPRKRYPDLVKEFGEPDLVVNRPGGVALWDDRDYWTSIMLVDESVEHKEPKPHCDFLYSDINVYVPDDVLPQVLQLSKSIWYDRLKKQLTARCHFMGANVATLWLAMKIVRFPSQANEWSSQYGATIMSTMQSPAEFRRLYAELGDMVRANQDKYASEMPNTNCTI